jgi:hypothetical protein
LENGYLHFAIIVSFYLFIAFVTNEFIMTEAFMFNSLFGQIPEQYIGDYIDFQKKWEWVSYLIFPVILLLKWTFIAAFIAMGAVFMGYNLSFRLIFKGIMSCEWLFVLHGIVNLTILLFSDTNSLADIERLNFVGKLSIGYLIDSQKNIVWLSQSLTALNIVQFIYVFLVSYAMWVISNTAFKTNLFLVIRSYIPALFIWIVLLIYISVSYG